MARKLTSLEWINQANTKHNNKYTYENAVYKNSRSKVIITCLEHGDFEQRPSHHLRKHGCPYCGDVIKHTLEVFIENSKEVHNNKYDYSKVIYVNNTTKVIIGCPIHGDFEQAPSNHTTQKQGCLDCAGNRKHTTTSFSNKANKVHNSKYDYSKTVYKSGKTKVTIICRIHGDFKITPNSHLRGVGCSSCAIRGFNRSRFSDISEFATLYIIRCFNDDESFYKIGITTKIVNKRFNKINMPYDYEVLTSLKTLSGLAFDLEKSLHNYLGESKYQPNIKFNGSSECFLMTKTKLDEIINIIEYREKQDAS